MSSQNPFPAVLGLTLAESRILACILARAPEPIARADIHATIYAGSKRAANERIIDVWVCYIRRKLAPYKITIGAAYGTGYVLDEASAATLREWMTRKPKKVVGALDPIPVALVITYFGERDRSPHAIAKMLQGEASLDSVKQVLSRARKQGRDVPTFYGGRANRPPQAMREAG